MGTICEHEFVRPDSENPDYSRLEYDLYAKTGLTIRKNLKANEYEIVTIREPREVKYSEKDIHRIVEIANAIEGAENTRVACSFGCGKD